MISEILTPGLIVELIVIFLLAVTAGYCFVLNKRLKAFRNSHREWEQTVRELNQATSRAEAAITDLKSMTDDADDRFSENMKKAKALSDHFAALSRQGQRTEQNVTRFRKAS